MILEFHEQLAKLPPWTRTRYYCYALNLRDVATERNISEDTLSWMMALSYIENAAPTSLIGMKTGTFRLGRYQLCMTANGEVEWQTPEGINRVVGGRCIIESDVLIIGAHEYEKSEQDKAQFLQELRGLPPWNYTMIWSRSMVLRECRNHGTTKASYAAPVQQETGKGTPTAPSLSFTSFRDQYSTLFRRSLLPGTMQLKMLLQRIGAMRFRLKYLILVVIAGLLLGLGILLHFVEKKYTGIMVWMNIIIIMMMKKTDKEDAYHVREKNTTLCDHVEFYRHAGFRCFSRQKCNMERRRAGYSEV